MTTPTILETLTHHKTSDDFDIYIGDIIKNTLSGAEGIVLSYAFNESQADQLRYAVTNDKSKKGIVNKTSWADLGRLKLVMKGERPDLLDPICTYGDVVFDISTGKEVVVTEVTFQDTGCVSYFAKRTGVDNDGNGFKTYCMKPSYIKLLGEGQSRLEDRYREASKADAPGYCDKPDETL